VAKWVESLFAQGAEGCGFEHSVGSTQRRLTVVHSYKWLMNNIKPVHSLTLNHRENIQANIEMHLKFTKLNNYLKIG